MEDPDISKIFFPSPNHPDQLYRAHLSLPFNGYQGSFPGILSWGIPAVYVAMK